MGNDSKIIRCYCNVGYLCDGNSYCDTKSVCLTKHVKYTNGKTLKDEFKYYCGEIGNSFRNDIIEYRDCLINTTIKSEYEQAIKSPEYCCKGYDFCNKDLQPYNFEVDSSYRSPHPPKFQPSFYNTSTAILFPVAIFLLIFLIFSIFALVYIRKRNEKLKSFQNNKISSKSEIYPFLDSQQISTTASVKIKDEKIGCIHIPKKLFLMNKKHKKPIYKESTSSAYEKPYILGENVLKTAHFHSQLNSSDNGISIPSGTVTTTVSSANTSSHCITITSNEDANIVGSINSNTNNTNTTNNSSSREYNTSNSSFIDSGSGFGNPVVINRTIARDITLLQPIGTGRYGQVWKSKWLEDLVAVKTFAANDSKSWENEINIYLTQCLRDDNILGFIAADNVDRGFYTELWIITEYHENGALYDYLNNKTVTPQQMIKMALSMTKGLLHLHRPIFGCKGKLPLAHCDLKTKNILVKKDLSCCIGDLGLALCGDIDGNLPSNIDIRTGTKRYMSPEILDRTIDGTNIGSYQKADMYSLSLIFWELLRRCEFIDPVTNNLIKFDFKLPYYEHADMNPDENQMLEIVCRKKLRPEILDIWKNSEIECIREFTNLIEELWYEQSDGRLKALSVKKRLDKLNNSYDSILEQT